MADADQNKAAKKLVERVLSAFGPKQGGPNKSKKAKVEAGIRRVGEKQKVSVAIIAPVDGEGGASVALTTRAMAYSLNNHSGILALDGIERSRNPSLHHRLLKWAKRVSFLSKVRTRSKYNLTLGQTAGQVERDFLALATENRLFFGQADKPTASAGIRFKITRNLTTDMPLLWRFMGEAEHQSIDLEVQHIEARSDSIDEAATALATKDVVIILRSFRLAQEHAYDADVCAILDAAYTGAKSPKLPRFFFALSDLDYIAAGAPQTLGDFVGKKGLSRLDAYLNGRFPDAYGRPANSIHRAHGSIWGKLSSITRNGRDASVRASFLSVNGFRLANPAQFSDDKTAVANYSPLRDCAITYLDKFYDRKTPNLKDDPNALDVHLRLWRPYGLAEMGVFAMFGEAGLPARTGGAKYDTGHPVAMLAPPNGIDIGKIVAQRLGNVEKEVDQKAA